MINSLNSQLALFQSRMQTLEQNKDKEITLAQHNVTSISELQLKITELMNHKKDLTQQIKDIQTQFDDAITKIQRLTDENVSLKQTLIKSSSNSLPKSKPITNNTNTHIEQPSPLLSPSKSKTNFNSIRLDNNSNNTIEQCNTQVSAVPKSALTQSKSQTKIGKKMKASSINDPSFTTSLAIFPSQREQLMKESKILEIESALYKLQKERDKLNDDLSKIPEFPKQKMQINKRRSLEYAIEEYNTKINTHKQKLRELNG